jgi:hypothetical protein
MGKLTASTSPRNIRPKKTGTIGIPVPVLAGVGPGVGVGVGGKGVGVGGGVAVGVAPGAAGVVATWAYIDPKAAISLDLELAASIRALAGCPLRTYQPERTPLIKTIEVIVKRQLIVWSGFGRNLCRF